MEETYATNDRILPVLDLGDPCVVQIKITDECVYLFVGQRDFQWSREDGRLIGCGTGLCGPPVPEPHLKLVKTTTEPCRSDD